MDLPGPPLSDTFCKQTGVDGSVCWTGLPLGDYRIYEVLPGGWAAIYPESQDFTLDEAGASFTFFDKVDGPTATEQRTWGRIKGTFR